MDRIRAFSSPSVLPASSTIPKERPEDHSFDGIATNVKLLLKLIQDHNEACTKENDDRKMQRVAGMITIIDDVKTRIQKSQSTGRRAELRRCNTDLRPNVPKDKRLTEPIIDEKERLRRQLSASLASQKSLEIMCSSLGKEKEIIASELTRKVQELSGMEEHINDLRAQNETLLAKVQACAAEHKEKRCGGVQIQGNVALQERNKMLSEQLLKSLDGCRSLKRKIKDALKQNNGMHSAMEEMGVEVQEGLDRIRVLKEKIATRDDHEQATDVKDEILALERLFECFSIRISKHEPKKGEFAKYNTEIDATLIAPCHLHENKG